MMHVLSFQTREARQDFLEVYEGPFSEMKKLRKFGGPDPRIISYQWRGKVVVLRWRTGYFFRSPFPSMTAYVDFWNKSTGCSAKKNTLLATYCSAGSWASAPVSTPIDAPTPLVSVEHWNFSVRWFWEELEQFENRHFSKNFPIFFFKMVILWL